MPGCFSGLAKINWPCTYSTHAIVWVIVTKFQFAINMILIVFVELFDTCMYAHCSVNCNKTFMLKVCLLSVP